MAKQVSINESGASLAIRAAVGNAPTEQRKSILERYYPKVYSSQDLQKANPDLDIENKYGADNLFFLDKSNNLTVYNPPGFDAGDISSVGRDLASGAGGFVGGALASPGVATTPLGVALGSEAGGQLYDVVSDALTPGEVKRPLAQNLIRAGENIGMEAVGGKIADNTMRGLKNIVQKGTQTLTGIKPGQRARDFDRLGIQPTLSTLTGSRGIANFEEVVGGNIFGANIIGASRDKLQLSLRDTAKKLTDTIGDAAENKDQIGGVIRTGSKNYFDKIQTKKETLYGAAFDAAGNVNVNLNNIRTLKATLENEVATAPNTLKNIYKPSLDKINNLLKDSTNGSVPLNVARQIRTEIGKIIGPATPGKIKIDRTGDGKLNAIYGSLSKDIFSSVDAVSPQASRLLKKADQYTKFVSKKTGGIEKTIEKIQNKGQDYEVYNFALQGGKQGSQRIKEVFKTLTIPERDAVSSSIFSRLGYNKSDPQSGWSPTTFLNEWDKLEPSVKRILFKKPRQKETAKEIDSLIRILRTVNERRLLDNTSLTGKVNIGFLNATSLLSAGGLLIAGEPEAAGGAIASTVLAPRYAAKLMTSPKFIRWVKSTAQVANKGVNPLAIQFGKLSVLPGKDGELAEAINAFTGNLSQNLSLPTVNIE